ncbi:MAG: hypothetical protein J6P72_07630, partial [Firmicutes bacterium]|nr:hypothetical protein [Bacillota bacterium]
MVQNDKPQDEVTGVTRDLHEFDFEDILPDDLPAVETASEPAMNEAELIKTQNISLITEEIQREQEQAQKKPEKKEK